MSERPRRLWMILGIVSVVLNVFLIGFLAGRHAFGPGGCSPRGVGRAAGPRSEFHKYVAPEQRALLRTKLHDVRTSRERVRAALEREPFDKAALEAALTGLRAHSEALQLDMHRMLIEGAEKLPLEQRKRLASSRFLRPALGPRGP